MGGGIQRKGARTRSRAATKIPLAHGFAQSPRRKTIANAFSPPSAPLRETRFGRVSASLRLCVKNSLRGWLMREDGAVEAEPTGWRICINKREW